MVEEGVAFEEIAEDTARDEATEDADLETIDAAAGEVMPELAFEGVAEDVG